MYKGDKSAKRKEQQKQKNLAKPSYKRIRGQTIQPTRIEFPDRGKGKKYNRHEWQKEARKIKNSNSDYKNTLEFLYYPNVISINNNAPRDYAYKYFWKLRAYCLN